MKKQPDKKADAAEQDAEKAAKEAQEAAARKAEIEAMNTEKESRIRRSYSGYRQEIERAEQGEQGGDWMGRTKRDDDLGFGFGTRGD